jgi:hypothetical protein
LCQQGKSQSHEEVDDFSFWLAFAFDLDLASIIHVAELLTTCCNPGCCNLRPLHWERWAWWEPWPPAQRGTPMLLPKTQGK